MTPIEVLTWDMKNLTKEQMAYLHDLKAKALTRWAEKELERLKSQ